MKELADASAYLDGIKIRPRFSSRQERDWTAIHLKS
jgi:hypothetical protein